MASHVVIQTAFLGDLFLSIPLLKRIKKNYPNDQLILVCKSGLGRYFLQEKIVDVIFEVKKGDRTSYLDMIQQLNHMNIINLYCIHRSLRSQLTSFKIKADFKIGFKSLLGYFIFDSMIQFKPKWPEAFRQLWLLTSTDHELKTFLQNKQWDHLNLADSSGVLAEIPNSSLFDSIDQRQTKSKSKKIAIFPGSVWATKKWTESGFAAVANDCIQKGYAVFLMGGPDEKQICLNIQRQCQQAQVLAGQLSIPESISFIRGCDLVIANDSAPTHMAAAENIPVVSIFGPTVLQQGFRPWSNQSRVVQNNNLNCRPCGRHGHQVCPLKHHKCMIEIQPEQVIQAASELLQTDLSV